MSSHFIENVPNYFDPIVNDCFSNALGSYILYKDLDPNIVMADYLSFIYDEEDNSMGINYLFKSYDTVIFTEEQLNVSLHFFYNSEIYTYDSKLHNDRNVRKDKINLFKYVSDKEKSYERMKELINQDKPVIAAIDLYYAKYHPAYMKKHGLHYIVITGYDESLGEYEVIDKYKLTNSDFEGRLSINEINNGRNSSNPLSDPIKGDYERPIQNTWTEVEIGEDFEVTSDDILAIIKESIVRMKGEKKVLGLNCGINMIKKCKEKIECVKNVELDENILFTFKSYYNYIFKVIARNRKRFGVFIESSNKYLVIDNSKSVIELLNLSAEKWDICANLSYKFGLCKKARVIDDISSKFEEIIQLETEIVNLLEKCVMDN